MNNTAPRRTTPTRPVPARAGRPTYRATRGTCTNCGTRAVFLDGCPTCRRVTRVRPDLA